MLASTLAQAQAKLGSEVDYDPFAPGEFKCGKTFLTFTHEAGDDYPRSKLTLPKRDVLRVLSVIRPPGNIVGATTFVTISHPLKPNGAYARAITDETRRRIIDCID